MNIERPTSNIQRPKLRKNKSTKFFLLAAHVILFLCVLCLPMNWTNKERLFHGFYWSMDGIHDFNTHIGLQKGDGLKSFHEVYVDGLFRARQVSYYTEMLSFKFWQKFGLVLVDDYGITFLHVLNAVLLFFLMARLTRNRAAAAVSALFFLNSGAALATILYPFRNAKLLVMTFFLLAWLILVHCPTPYGRMSWRRLSAFFVVAFLAFLTDEMALFIFPLLAFFVIIRDGWKGVLNRRVLTALMIFLLVTFVCFKGAAAIALKVNPASSATGLHHKVLKDLVEYYREPLIVLRDLGRALFVFFLRRDFGYWDLSWPGLAAAVSCLMLLGMAGVAGMPTLEKRLALAVSAVFIVKMMILPHGGGLHKVFMPPDTRFPCLLFFSYYYVYAEAVLVAIVVGLALSAAVRKRSTLVLALLFVINVSTVLHLSRGPRDALTFMNFVSPYRQARVRNVKRVQKVIGATDNQPVYLSFPAGPKMVLKGRLGDSPELTLYQRMIPIRYLNAIRNGTAIVSYANMRPRTGLAAGEELVAAKTFYVVATQELFDLTGLKVKFGDQALVSKKMRFGEVTSISVKRANGAAQRVVFFVKGEATLLWDAGQGRQGASSTYGQSYQRIQFDWAADGTSRPGQGVCVIKAGTGGGPVAVAGPFVLPAAEEAPSTANAIRHRQRSRFLEQDGFRLLSAAQEPQEVALALNRLRQAVNQDPKNLSAYLTLGRAYMAVGSFREAIKIFRAGFILFSDNGDLHNWLAVCHAKLEAYGLAAHEARRSFEIYEANHQIQKSLRSKRLLVQYLQAKKESQLNNNHFQTR